MRIIPVIDLRGGRAVHGRAGDRARYRPVRSRLVGEGSRDLQDPLDLLRAYRRTIGSDLVYVADLDRIERLGTNDGVVQRLSASLPEVRILLDAGEADAAAVVSAPYRDRIDRVMATETLSAIEELASYSLHGSRSDPVLSLDLRADGVVARSPSVAALGELGVLREAARRGLDRAIILMLDRIGLGTGPPRERLQRLRDAAPDLELFAGGGLATMEDLEFLRRVGFSGALVATALHEGRLRPDALRRAGFVPCSPA